MEKTEIKNGEGGIQVFTLRINFDNTPEGIEASKWIWDAMKTGQPVNGIRIDAMRNGDGIHAETLLKNIITIHEDTNNNIEYDEDASEQVEDLEEKLEETWERYRQQHI